MRFTMPRLRTKALASLNGQTTKERLKKHKYFSSQSADFLGREPLISRARSTKALLEQLLSRPSPRQAELLVPLESEAGQNMQNPKVLYMLGIREVLTFDMLPSVSESSPLIMAL